VIQTLCFLVLLYESIIKEVANMFNDVLMNLFNAVSSIINTIG